MLMTSAWLEGDCCPLAEYGYSRNKRFDKKQIVLGLLTTAEGLPIAHQVWPGKRVEVDTVREMTETLKDRFQIGETVFVGDCGMLSVKNIEALGQAGYGYILGLKSRSREARDVIVPETRPVPFEVYEVVDKDKLLAREVKGSGDVRYVICHSYERAEVDRAQRTRQIEMATAKLKRLDADLKSGRIKDGETLQRRLATIFSGKHVRRYFHWSCDTKAGRPTLSWSLKTEAVTYEEHREGKWVIKANTSLSVSEGRLKMALDFGRSGKPTDSALIESFNGRLRTEGLNENWFLSLEDAHARLDD